MLGPQELEQSAETLVQFPQGICGVFQVGCIGMGIVQLAFGPSICMFKAARGAKGGSANC